MAVKILCPDPDCDASYSVVDENLGKLGRCKKCGTTFPLVPHTRDGGPPSPSATDLDSGPRPPDPALPESFGRYKVLKLLGRGGMGSVYLALDTQLRRQVAVKVPHIVAFADRPDVRARFFREAEAAARFQHPNFCPIFDIGEVDGVPYLTMAFIEGKTLAASIEWGQGWPPRRAAKVARDLAIALAELHRRGIVHRDLKPANIMVDARGSLILMDFGLARCYDELDSTFTPTGAILGTPAYMPPEQAQGNLKVIGPRSDLYSLGVILYELLTGRRPFEGPITKVLGMISFVEPPPPSTHRPDLDPRLEAIGLKAMAKKPDDRHASMDDFARALQAWLDPPRSVGKSTQVANRSEASQMAADPERVRPTKSDTTKGPNSSRRRLPIALFMLAMGCGAPLWVTWVTRTSPSRTPSDTAFNPPAQLSTPANPSKNEVSPEPSKVVAPTQTPYQAMPGQAPKSEEAKLAVAAVPDDFGLFEMIQGIVLKSKMDDSTWDRVEPMDPLEDRIRLLNLAPFRNTLNLGMAKIDLVDSTEVILCDSKVQSAQLELRRGRISLRQRPGSPPFVVKLEGQLVAISVPFGSVVGVERNFTLLPGQAEPIPARLRIFVSRGRAGLKVGTTEETLNGPAAILLETSGRFSEKGNQPLPSWVTETTPSV